MRLAGLLLATGPEELLLPFLQMLRLVDVWEQAGEDADTVERIAVGRELRVWEGGMVFQNSEARSDGEKEGLEIR